MKLPIVICLIIVIVFIVIKVFPLIKICGDSMYPSFNDGDIVIASRVFSVRDAKVGDVYVYKPPYSGEEARLVVKRITKIRYEGEEPELFHFEGDNAEVSYDSRYYGYVSPDLLYAKVIKKVRK